MAFKSEDPQIGDRVTDTITGFTGVITGRCEYISGCDQLLVQPRVKEDGSAQSGQWIDVDRVTVDETSAYAKPKPAVRVGSDMPAPIR